MSLSHNFVRLRPRNHGPQICLRHDLTVTPAPATQSEARLLWELQRLLLPAGIAPAVDDRRAERGRGAPAGGRRPIRKRAVGASPRVAAARRRNPIRWSLANSASIPLTCRGLRNWRLTRMPSFDAGKPLSGMRSGLDQSHPPRLRVPAGFDGCGTPGAGGAGQAARRVPGLRASANRLLALFGIGCALRQRLSGHYAASWTEAHDWRGCVARLGQRFYSGNRLGRFRSRPMGSCPPTGTSPWPGGAITAMSDRFAGSWSADGVIACTFRSMCCRKRLRRSGVELPGVGVLPDLSGERDRRRSFRAIRRDRRAN